MSNEMLKNKIAVVAGFQKDIADEIAKLTGTINYEVACNISKRVPREVV